MRRFWLAFKRKTKLKTVYVVINVSWAVRPSVRPSSHLGAANSFNVAIFWVTLIIDISVNLTNCTWQTMYNGNVRSARLCPFCTMVMLAWLEVPVLYDGNACLAGGARSVRW